MASRAAKVRAVAEGAAVGGAWTAGAVGAIHYSMKGLAAVAPRAAAVVARAGGTVASLPVVAAAAGVGAAYGGFKAYRSGGSAGSVALGALGGAASLGTNIVVDAFTRPAAAQEKKKKESPEQASISESARLYSRAAQLEKQGKYEEAKKLYAAAEAVRGGTPAKPAAPVSAVPAPKPDTPKPGLLQQAKDAVFGPAGPKEEDALAREARQLEEQSREIRKRMDVEFSGGGSGQKGVGKNYKDLEAQLGGIEKRKAEITKQQTSKEAEETAAYRQLGAIIAGAAIGGVLGKMTEKAATVAAEAAGKGVSQLARTAVSAVNKSPKGVIAGTVQGDKAAAAVSAANAAMNKPLVSAASAFGLPALNIAHGAVNYKLGQDKSNPAAPILQAEGAGAIAAGVFGLKYGVAAYGARAVVSPAVMGKFDAARNRLAREARSGPAGVAQARGRRLVSDASGAAGVAGARAQRDVARAGSSRDVARVKGAASVDRARIETGAQLSSAKVRGAASVERSKIDASGANSRAIQRQNADIRYQNVWQDKRGRVYHRKDMSVRTRKGKAVANDNGPRSRRRARA